MNILKSIEFAPENDKQQFKEYLYEREKAIATIRKYLTDIETFFKFLAGDFRVDKKRVLEYKDWLCMNYAVSSANTMLVALNQFFDFAGAGTLKVNKIKIQNQTFKAAAKVMSINEYNRLVSAASSQKKYRLAMGIETLATTGARISELAFFTVEQVKRGMIEIDNKGKRRIILIPDGLQKKLLYYASKNNIKRGRIFITKNGKAIDRSNFWRQMKALKRSAGVSEEKIFPHNLRHLFARLFYKATKDLSGLADLLGHSSLDVTRIYTASSAANYKRQIGKLGTLIEQRV